MMCSEDDLKELSIPMGPRKKILSYQRDYAKEKVYSTTSKFLIYILINNCYLIYRNQSIKMQGRFNNLRYLFSTRNSHKHIIFVVFWLQEATKQSSTSHTTPVASSQSTEIITTQEVGHQKHIATRYLHVHIIVW